MKPNVNGKFTPINAMMFFLALLVMAYLFSQVILVICLLPFIDLQELAQGLSDYKNLDPAAKPYILLAQGLISLVLFVVTPVVYFKIAGVNFNIIQEGRKKTGPFYVVNYLFVGMIIIGFMPLNGYIAELNAMIPFPDAIVDMEKKAEEMTKFLTTFDSIGQVLLGVAVIALIAGIGEELTFRGVLQNQVSSLIVNKHVAIWVTAAIFSAIHLQFLGFFPRMLLGALFGYFYWWSGDIKLAMFGHFVNNGFSVIAIHMYHEGTLAVNVEEVPDIPLNLALYSAGFTSVFIYILRHRLTQQQQA